MLFFFIRGLLSFLIKKIPQIWSSKWCVKDEPKHPDLANSVVAMSTPPNNNNNNNNSTQNNSNPTNNASSNNSNNPSANTNSSSYYDTHNVFPSSVNNNNNQDTILYDSITTISQAQNTLYAPSIGTAIGELKFYCLIVNRGVFMYKNYFVNIFFL